jgi:hypothetical protein
MSDGCSTAKERDDDAKAMTMIKRLTILTSRRTELDRTGSILPSTFSNCLRRCRDCSFVDFLAQRFGPTPEWERCRDGAEGRPMTKKF